MHETHMNRVRWSGARSIEEVKETLYRFGNVEIQLPPDYHHALFAHLHPEASTASIVERIDESDGADLLRRVAEVRGLDELDALLATVIERHARVHLLSPVPLIILSLPSRA